MRDWRKTMKKHSGRYLEKELKDPEFASRFRKAGEARDVSLQIAALRKRAGLSQQDLAKLLKTSQQQISRLESPDYQGHSLSMVRRVAEALGAKVRVVFEPADRGQGRRVAESAEPYGKTNAKKVNPEKLDKIIRRIVQVAGPEKIIMFGSAARGEMGPHSDVDLLVIKKGKYHRGRLIERIYRNMRGVGQALDIIVVTPEDVERYKDSFGLVIYPALRDGKVLYAA
jgi:transcriptional regulator with XRE-family HTH domain